MRKTIAAISLAALLIIVIAASGCSDNPEDNIASEEFHQRYDIVPGTELDVVNRNGDIIITKWNNDWVDVSAYLITQEGRGELDKVDILVVEGPEMEIRTLELDGQARVNVRYEIYVPDAVTVQMVKTQNGDLELSNTNGNTTLNTTSGSIRAIGPNGYVYAETYTGDIEIIGAHGVLGAYSTAGDIKVDIPTLIWNTTIASENGQITVSVNKNIDALLDLSCFGGRITVEGVAVDYDVNTPTAVSGTMGAGGKLLSVRAGIGDIHLKPM